MKLANTSISTVARMGKFARGQLLARSIKLQRQMLAIARAELAKGAAGIARVILSMWHAERRAYRLALAWQAV